MKTIVRETKNIHRVGPGFLLETKRDGTQGIVDAIVSVMGIIDLGDDIIHNGAYLKTISERAGKIRVLDSHNTRSVFSAVGRPLMIKEIGRSELPKSVTDEFPMATGGLFTSTQYMLDDEDSMGVFKRIENDFINEYSIGFDILQSDFGKAKDVDGTERVVRNIRQIRLYEYSPVLWGMNQATATTGVKGEDMHRQSPIIIQSSVKGGPPEGYTDAPQAAANRCASCQFYRSENSNTGHCDKFDFIAMADYVCNDYKPGGEADKTMRKEYTPDGPQKRLGDFLRAETYSRYMNMCNSLYSDGYVDETEHRNMCQAGIMLMDTISSGMTPDCAMRPYDPFNMFDLLFFGGHSPEQFKSKAFDWAEQIKAGRVLSERNITSLRSAETSLRDAADIIETVLRDAGAETSSSEDDTEKAGTPPNAQGETSTNWDAKRQEIEIYLAELDLED